MAQSQSLKFCLLSSWIGTCGVLLPASPPPTCLHFTWSGQALSLQARNLFWKAENALQGVGEFLTMGPSHRWGQVVLSTSSPAALTLQQPLGMGLGSWNVLHGAPSLATPLPPFPVPVASGCSCSRIGGEQGKKVQKEGYREAGADTAQAQAGDGGQLINWN